MRPPDRWTSARATLAIAAATALAWLTVSALGAEQFAVFWAGFIPERVNGTLDVQGLAPVWLTPLTATFVHAGLVHIALNLLMLLFCGRPVENILGPLGLVILYVAGAYAAAAGQYLLHFNSETAAPMVGASGAISAVIGAFALMFGRNRVRIASPRLALLIHAAWLAAAWVGLQLLAGFTFETQGARLAVGAHIGGFIAGLVLMRPLLLLRYRNA